MRIPRFVAAGVLAAAVTGLAAPAAMAESMSHFSGSVSPGTVAPGGRVTLSAHGCRGPVTVSSGVFDTVTLNGHARTVRVDSDAKPGASYTVKFDCDGRIDKTELMISSLMPVGPAQTGLGGASTGRDTAELAGGAALLAAAAGTVVIRRRRAGNNA